MHIGAVQVPPIDANNETAKPLIGPANMTVRRNGWLYVYLSNDSNQDVYFDDLVINHKRGPVVEQTNYYPFGLEIPGLHSQALGFGGSENRFNYNGKELQARELTDGRGLTWNDYGARMYDTQIGRWMVVDPLADISRRWSPYTYAYNNPIGFIDPDGMTPVGADGLTNEQWMEASRPGADPNISKNYRYDNQDQDPKKRSGATGTWDAPEEKVKVAEAYSEMTELEAVFYDVSGRNFNVILSDGLTRGFVIDAKGEIDLNGGRIIPMEAGFSIGSLRALSKLRDAKNMIQFVRSGSFFKNIQLKDFLAKYYRKTASIGNGSSADALIFEAITGKLLSPAGHFQKVKDARTFFVRLLGNNSNVLSEFEKQFVVRQILEASRALKTATKLGHP